MYFWIMTDVMIRLQELEIVARKMVKQVNLLKTENARLQKENALLKGKENPVNGTLNALEASEIVDIDKQLKSEIIQDIDQCLNEIDNCLESLNEF